MRFLFALLAAVFSLAAAPAQTQERWPQRTVTLVVPFTAGGSTDLIARILAQHMQSGFGAPVVGCMSWWRKSTGTDDFWIFDFGFWIAASRAGIYTRATEGELFANFSTQRHQEHKEERKCNAVQLRYRCGFRRGGMRFRIMS